MQINTNFDVHSAVESAINFTQDLLLETGTCMLTSLSGEPRGIAIALVAQRGMFRLNREAYSRLPKDFLLKPVHKNAPIKNAFLLMLASYVSSVFVGREVARYAGFDEVSMVPMLLGGIAYRVAQLAYMVYSLSQPVNLFENCAVINLTAENFKEQVTDSKTPVLIDTYASWCGPCRAFAPTVAEVSNELKGRVKVLKLNTDEQKDLAIELGVKAIPALFFYKEGEVVDQSVGAMPKDELIKKLESNFGPLEDLAEVEEMPSQLPEVTLQENIA